VAQVPVDTSRSGDSRRVGGNESNNPEWKSAFIERADATWRTTNSFACVVGYALANNSANGICLYESYLYLKSLEHKRPIIYPSAGGEWNNDGNF
jgi:beta-galactosidase